MDCKLFLSSVCPRPESNRHALRQLILSQSWLPLHHGGKGGTGQNVLNLWPCQNGVWPVPFVAVAGIEPTLIEPKSMVLTITPHGNLRYFKLLMISANSRSIFSRGSL